MKVYQKLKAEPYIAAPKPGIAFPFREESTAHPETMLRAFGRGDGLGMLNPSVSLQKHTTYVYGRPCQAQTLEYFRHPRCCSVCVCVCLGFYSLFVFNDT